MDDDWKQRPGLSFYLPFLLVAVGFVYVGLNIGALPAEIASHFDLHGQPDGSYAGREVLWTIPILSLIINVVMAATNRLPIWCPDKVNVPVKLTEQNRDRVLHLCYNLLTFTRWITSILLLSITVSMVIGAKTGAMPSLMVTMVPWIVILFFGTAAYISAMRREG